MKTPMTAEDHIAKAKSLQNRSRMHGGLFGRGTRKRMLEEAQLHMQLAQTQMLQEGLERQEPPASPGAQVEG